MGEITTEEITESTENREIKKGEDLPLDVAEWQGADRRDSDYPKTDYYVSYKLELEDGNLIVLNSASKRLEQLYEELAERFDGVENIPAGELIKMGEGFNTHFTYEWED